MLQKSSILWIIIFFVNIKDYNVLLQCLCFNYFNNVQLHDIMQF